MEDIGIRYQPYWVAYFDLLGFEKRVKTMDRVNPILRRYDEVLTVIRNNAGAIGSRWFSDTFVFYTPDNSKTSYRGIAGPCESFFYWMINLGVPVRGCLTVGNFYVDEKDGVLVGPVLIDAYHLGECQDWIGFVLSPDAVARCNQYKIRRDGYGYKEYDVPISDKRSGKLRTERLEAYNLSYKSPCCTSPCPPDEWWKRLDGMEKDVLNYNKPEERERVFRKYHNSKKFLLSLYPQLAK